MKMSITLLVVLSLTGLASAEMLCDHEAVVVDGYLQPWTSFDNIIHWSMNYIEHCPKTHTRFGEDPWYLVTSKINEDGTFKKNQNNQGSNTYYAVETLTRYYAYTGDKQAFKPVRRLLDRVRYYHTPRGWAWPDVPRTQDNTPDGEYTDVTSEPDKMCMTGYAYAEFYQLTGEEKYLKSAVRIADVILTKIGPGDADHSPLPFRVNLKTGAVLVPYTSNMIAPVAFFQKLIELGQDRNHTYQAARDRLWQWILAYPMKNNRWSNYYEDVRDRPDNLNQQMPVETARFMLRHPDFEPNYKEYVPALIAWAKNRFGQTQRYGATSMREQDECFYEMSSHTSRYASVLAKWFGMTGDAQQRKEAYTTFGLVTYSAMNKYSKGNNAINYVGVGYVKPWFSDSYFDYLCHILEGMAELPEMAPADQDHILSSTSVVTFVKYDKARIEYRTADKDGNEIIRMPSPPHSVSAPHEYGEYRGVPGVLRISRHATDKVVH